MGLFRRAARRAGASPAPTRTFEIHSHLPDHIHHEPLEGAFQQYAASSHRQLSVTWLCAHSQWAKPERTAYQSSPSPEGTSYAKNAEYVASRYEQSATQAHQNAVLT